MARSSTKKKIYDIHIIIITHTRCVRTRSFFVYRTNVCVLIIRRRFRHTSDVQYCCRDGRGPLRKRDVSWPARFRQVLTPHRKRRLAFRIFSRRNTRLLCVNTTEEKNANRIQLWERFIGPSYGHDHHRVLVSITRDWIVSTRTQRAIKYF